MKAMVLGMGLQGKAVIHDLEASDLITGIFAADLFPTEERLNEAEAYIESMGYVKTTPLRLDVSKKKDLPAVFANCGIAIVICMLPIQLALKAAAAALDAGIPFVSSNYTYDLIQLNARAKEKKGIILPEMGLDPGIDLVLGRLAVDQLDKVHGLYSYGGGSRPRQLPRTVPSNTRSAGFSIASWMSTSARPAKLKTAGCMLSPARRSSSKRMSMRSSFRISVY
jgi:lysine 6-dehydrogenase